MDFLQLEAEAASSPRAKAYRTGKKLIGHKENLRLARLAVSIRDSNDSRSGLASLIFFCQNSFFPFFSFL